jgi:hypothetical protein
MTMSWSPLAPVSRTQHGGQGQVNLNVPAAPIVAIIQAAGLLTLSWPHQILEATAYEVWRSTEPYFTPGQADAGRESAQAHGVETWLTWSDPDTAGNPMGAYYYRVCGLDAALQLVNTSRPVGRFTFSIAVPGD